MGIQLKLLGLAFQVGGGVCWGIGQEGAVTTSYKKLNIS